MSDAAATEPTQRGRPRNQDIAAIIATKKCSRATAYRKAEKKRTRKRTMWERLENAPETFNPLIKPTDNWNFSEVVYDRLVADGTHGYIPGDLYANALFYFTKPGDLVVAPFAGSGQIQRVYDTRAFWMRERERKGGPLLPDAVWDLDLRLFDLNPRGPYRNQITQWNILEGFPPISSHSGETKTAPDYVIMDPPYLGACRGQYSSKDTDIANMDVAAWTSAMGAVADACASVQAKLCTIVVPTWVNHDNGDEVLCPEIIRDQWRATGYRLVRAVYASKRIQAGRADRIVVLNCHAKRKKLMLSDISEVLTFRLTGEGGSG